MKEGSAETRGPEGGEIMCRQETKRRRLMRGEKFNLSVNEQSVS